MRLEMAELWTLDPQTSSQIQPPAYLPLLMLLFNYTAFGSQDWMWCVGGGNLNGDGGGDGECDGT